MSHPEWRSRCASRYASNQWRLPSERTSRCGWITECGTRFRTSKGPLYIATPYATRLDEVATATFRGAPDDLARLGFAVAHALDPEAPSAEDFPLAAEIANALKSAKKPLVISGMSCSSQAVMEAAANVAMAAHAAISLTAPECNTVGAALIGGSPLTAAFEAVKDGGADTVIILENDLYRRAPAAEVDAFFGAAKHVIVLDHLANPTTAKAELELHGRDLRRIRRHIHQQRRTCPEILPGFCTAERSSRKLALVEAGWLAKPGRCTCDSVEGIARTGAGLLCGALSQVSNCRSQNPALTAPRERPDRRARQHHYFRAQDT